MDRMPKPTESCSAATALDGGKTYSQLMEGTYHKK